jgi:hypothetical protein
VAVVVPWSHAKPIGHGLQSSIVVSSPLKTSTLPGGQGFCSKCSVYTGQTKPSLHGMSSKEYTLSVPLLSSIRGQTLPAVHSVQS